MARALVTGGSGYFGTMLVAELLEHGDTVRTFDLNPPDGALDVEHVGGDIRDSKSIRGACEDIDVVYHNVAQAPLAKDPGLLESVNVGGTDTLLRAAAEAGVDKVVFTSSSSVYGIPTANPLTERTALSPAEVYGQTKA